MVSEKPWRADALILLFAGLMLSAAMGALLVQALPKLFPQAANADQTFLKFIVGTLSVQCAALILIHQFFRWHNASWRDVLLSRGRSLLKVFGLGVLVGVVVLPLALLLLNVVSLELTKVMELPAEKQTAVTVIEKTVDARQRIWFGLAAILLAPLVEELLFRGIMYPYLKQRLRPIWAVLITSMVFAAIHVNVMIFIPLVFLGMVLTWLYERTDSLLAPIATHMVFNASNFLMLVYQ